MRAYNELDTLVWKWAIENLGDDPYYSAQYSYWRSAQSAGIITDEEFEMASKLRGDMFHYTGD